MKRLVSFRRKILPCCILLCLMGYLVLYWQHFAKEKHFSVIAKEHQRHILTKDKKDHSKSATLITAIYDIKRDHWPTFQRKFKKYLDYFINVLLLQTNLVLFCENTTLELLKLNDEFALHPNIYTIVRSFEDLEYEQYRTQIEKTINSEEFKANNTILKHPEAYSTDYLILMNNKLSFMKEAIDINPFKSTHFFWIDAGYGHGNRTNFPPKYVYWEPKKLLNISNVVTYITLFSNPYIFQRFEYKYHKMQLSPVLNGAFFGGDKQAVIEYYYLYGSVFTTFLYRHNIVDDDQNIAISCVYRRPKLFRLVLGGWNDVIQLFG